MADDDTKIVDESVGSFDTTKKKKKKKVYSADEDAPAEPTTVESSEKSDSQFAGKKKKKKDRSAAAAEGDEEKTGDAEVEELSEEVSSLDLKKKKKKKKDRTKEEQDEEAPKEEKAEVEEGKAGEEGGEEEEAGEREEKEDDFDDGEAEGIDLGAGVVENVPVKLPWEGTDRDYLYEELLGRVFSILRSNNPELAGEKRRTVMRPPQVLREGTKKTVFVNFMDLCKTMHRQSEHVMAFLLSELGTSGSLDGQQRLIVKGRFAPKNFEGILRRYVNEYVLCTGCKSPDTTLTKENRLFFLRCEQCGSHRSVAPIKAGFVARVGRRKATA